MASDNTVEIDFTADTSDFTEGTEAASASIAALGQQATQSMAVLMRQPQAIAQAQVESASATQAAWNGVFPAISKAFGSSIDGMVRGTQTLDQTVRRMAQNIVAEYADAVVQSGLHWAEGETQKTLATEVGNAQRTASAQGASSEGLAIEGAANRQSVIGNAWSAAAAVYNNVAQIPYVGWVLAPAAAATAAAAVLAFGGSIPSAAGGWVVPSDTMAMVHENEMILPAHLSQGIAGMIASGQGGGSTNHFHFNPQLNGKLNPDDIDGLHGAFKGYIAKALRNGEFGMMRGIQ